MGLRQIISLTRNRQESSGHRRNRGQTRGRWKNMGLSAKHRAREEEKGREELRQRESFKCPESSGPSYLIQRLWRVLCGGGGGGNSWSWTVATHRSSSVHSLLLFLSLSGPPPTLPLTLLPEFCSNSQSDHLPLAPAWEEEGKFHSVTSGGWRQWWWESTGAPLRFPLCQWNDQVQTSSLLSNTKHNSAIVLIPNGRLPSAPGRQTCQSQQPAWLSLSLSLSTSVSSHQTCWATFHLPPWSLPPALRVGLLQGGCTSGWHRWSTSYQHDWLKGGAGSYCSLFCWVVRH